MSREEKEKKLAEWLTVNVAFEMGRVDWKCYRENITYDKAMYELGKSLANKLFESGWIS